MKKNGLEALQDQDLSLENFNPASYMEMLAIPPSMEHE